MELCVGGAVMPQGVGTHHPEPLPVVQLMPQGGGALTGGMAGMAAPDPKNAFWRLWQQAGDIYGESTLRIGNRLVLPV